MIYISFFICIFSSLIGNIKIQEIPCAIIQGKESKLHRPEGLTFTPDGKYLAVANNGNNSITFYAADGKTFESIPSFILDEEEALLNRPHDLSISPDGNYLAVANSLSNEITIYKKNEENGFYHSIPIATIEGDKDKFNGKQAVKFAPHANILAVANIWSNTVTLHHFDENSCRCYQLLKSTKIKLPDGLNFSHDGKLLAIANHNADTILFFEQIDPVYNKYSKEPIRVINGKKNNFLYSHSICFSPDDTHFVVSSPSGLQTLHLFKAISPKSIQSLSVKNREILNLDKKYPGETGVKGVCFTPDGKCLAICLPYLYAPYRKILIFPVIDSQ